jgi:hypothetical protein
MKMHRLILALASLTAGCSTSLTIKRFNESDPSSAVGAPFPLMFTQYDIAVSRQVIGCGPKLKAKVSAEIKTNKTLPDPNQLFVLDTGSLSSALKTGAVKTTYYPTGSVATLNANAEDKSAAVIANVVQTFAKVVTISAAAGALPGAPVEACTDETKKALAEVVKGKADVEASGTLVEGRQGRLEELIKKVNATGGHPDGPTKKALSEAYDDLTAATKDLSDKTEALEKALKAIAYKEVVHWPKNGDTEGETIPLPESIFSRWGRLDDDENSRAAFAISIRLESTGGAARRSLAVPQNVNPSLGIPYRAPAQGTLRVCSGKSCIATDAAIAETTGQVQQLGHIYYLPCSSRPFASVSCTLEFAEGGELKTAGSEQKASVAEGLSGAAKEAVTQIAAAKEARSATDTNKLEAKTAALKAQTDYENALKASRPDPSATTKAETDAVNAEADLFAAKKKKIDAELALLEAQSKVSP